MPAEYLSELPFLNGVYVAIDALRGSYLVVDGPYCVFTKAEMQYCHNLRSRLEPHLGHARVVHTATDADREEVASAALDRTELVRRIFERVCALPDADVVLATSFDFHQLLGFPLEAIARDFAGRSGKLVCHVPSRSLGGTWLEGYALVCEALARAVPLRRGRGAKDAVAVVGYLFDRDEPDHHGNLAELARLLRALGLEVRSVWLSGGDLAALRAAEEASLVVSLPYAREAARVVAERVGADLVELELPLGLSASAEAVRALARSVGREARGEEVVRDELARAVSDTRAHVLRIVRGNTARVRGTDPTLVRALEGLCAELGVRVLADGAPSEAAELGCHELTFEPTLTPTPSRGVHVPVGYPNYVEHPVQAAPFLGFAGYRTLVDRIASSILRAEARDPDGAVEGASRV